MRRNGASLRIILFLLPPSRFFVSQFRQNGGWLRRRTKRPRGALANFIGRSSTEIGQNRQPLKMLQHRNINDRTLFMSECFLGRSPQE
jgi:hypothetical protein